MIPLMSALTVLTSTDLLIVTPNQGYNSFWFFIIVWFPFVGTFLSLIQFVLISFANFY